MFYFGMAEDYKRLGGSYDPWDPASKHLAWLSVGILWPFGVFGYRAYGSKASSSHPLHL